MGNTKACFIALCIVVATVGQCFAWETGNDIRERCQITQRDDLSNRTSTDANKVGFCQGYVDAIFNLGRDLAEPYRFCHPDEATIEQAISVLLKYLNEH